MKLAPMILALALGSCCEDCDGGDQPIPSSVRVEWKREVLRNGYSRWMICADDWKVYDVPISAFMYAREGHVCPTDRYWSRHDSRF